jgi:penicillin amidase
MKTRSSVRALIGLALATLQPALMAAPPGSSPIRLPGLKAAAEVTRDVHGIAHVRAGNDEDMYFLQGWVHAQDRLFQMDTARRLASGTLAELLGPAALPSDVELRTIGIRRAAERSLAVISPETRAALEAYARGVNAYVAGAGALPPEYAALEISRFQPWTVLDAMTVAKSITFSLSFGLEDIDNTIALQTYTAVFDPQLGAGTGATLFSQDLWRSQPFFLASTVPDAMQGQPAAPSAQGGWQVHDGHNANVLARRYAQRVRDLPFFKQRMGRDQRPASNQWAVAGWRSASGRPMVANDPHLALQLPSTFYPIHLKGSASIDVMGNSFAGAPFVVVGQTRQIAWGATVSPLDVTDVFQEQLVPDAASPSGLSTVYLGRLEAVIPIPQTYRVNPLDGVMDNLATVPPGGAVPAVTLIVPRRNNGPIVEFDAATGTAISVQYTGFSGTRELDALHTWNRARGLADFQRGLPFFDSGTQNLAYADIDGNIAYFAASEVPLREDLQAGTVNGVPPWFIRNGTGGNEWLPLQALPPGQAIPYQILPAAEMPQLLNPPAGYFVNANNDPAGTVLDNDPLNTLRPGGGLYYLNPGYDMGLRAGRITELVASGVAQGPLTFAAMQAIQADVVLPDAATFVPYLLQAFARAGQPGAPAVLTALAAPAAMQDARARLAAWSLKAPTGIAKGYDAADVNGVPGQPGAQEVADSVAATLYTVWRAQFIANTIDATLDGLPLPPGVSLPKPGSDLTMTALKTLLERAQPGVGVSGLNFFNVPGVASAADRRDILVLKSLSDALARLAGPEYAAAFGGSGDLSTYRWGRLHRIVFEHPLGGVFNLPTVNPLGEALPGYPVDGGFGTVDVAAFDVRANDAASFMFSDGAVNRFVAEGPRSGMRAVSAWPGGTSGVLGSPYYGNLLPGYLTNDSIPLLMRPGDLAKATASVMKFVP